MSNVVKKVQTYHYAMVCRNKNGVVSRFNTPWVPSDKTRIVSPEENINETKVKQSKNLIEKVLVKIVTMIDLSDITQPKPLEEYGVKDINYEVHSIDNIFLTKHEVSAHKAFQRVLSLPMRQSNVNALYFPTGLKKYRIRMLKSLLVLEKMHPDDANVASNIIDKYENQPDTLHLLCLADFAASYVSKKAGNVPIEPDDIKSNNFPVFDVNGVETKPIFDSFKE